MADLIAIIRAYATHHRERTATELRSFAEEPTIRAAISRAGLARRPDGKRYAHQSRIPERVLLEAQSRLLESDIEECRSFVQLHGRISDLLSNIAGIGELTIYDTALRIGARLNVEPQRIYLHRGTREGARALDLNWRAPWLSPNELPAELQDLPPLEVEDILCIFKKELRQVTRTAPTSRTRGLGWVS